MAVRLVKCNSLDLNLFQFDHDLTFCIFFLNADRTIYARYGTRSGRNADDDVSIQGLAATMRDVLELHKHYPDNAVSLRSKQPLPSKQSIPEEYDALDHFKPKLDYEGKVAKSCIHCHQVREAARLEFRVAKQPLPEKLLYPFPSADVLGLKFDTATRSTLLRVKTNSAASRSGVIAGDIVEAVNGNSISSEADFGWLLHNTDADARSVKLKLDRNNNPIEITLELPEGWRKKTDLSWRPTSWDLRRMATGGMTLVPVDPDQRSTLDLDKDGMALRADHVGMYGNHARAKKAGIRKGDVILSFDGRNDLMTESQLIEYAVQNKKPGDRVAIRYRRGKKEFSTHIRLQ